ncbi:MAG: MBL fold metallo-hydrolase [Betaproteobacteria bacterium]|nr:MBL fold metallo-hydrolase [Betaproteobacteria bacterium]MDE2047779.1 MBL fold metallo-hydrolase [Betaproteobacteria bacterium]
MSKAFASQADLAAKQITFEQMSEHCWAYTAEGDPNSGVIIGDDCCMVLDTTATPAMAQDLIARIRSVTAKPIKYVFLTHYHAVRVLGASAYFKEGATEIICSAATRELIAERGAQDMQSEIERFPRLFAGVDSIPGLTWPTQTFDTAMTLYLGKLEVQLRHVGPGHTRGDAIAWVPSEKVLYSGDLVEMEAGVYTGDAQLEEWPQTLQALRALGASKLMPGRGAAMKTPADVNRALDYTARWVTLLYQSAREAVAAGLDLKAAFALAKQRMDPIFGHVPIYEHCMPFDVSRAVDEARGIKHPRIWTAERDKEMWAALQS